jgi:glycosyltransferase involved in cell wall biosynthesis
MSRTVAFYAPLKPPDHPVPSGDRRMARTLIEALGLAGWRVELASRLRSYDRAGDPHRQQRIQAIGTWQAGRLVRALGARPPAERPAAWLTYHAYHKSPDWLGPAVADALGIPYLLVEASHARKQAGGPWALGHGASASAIRRAEIVLALSAVDAAGLTPLVARPHELRRLPPCLDPAPYVAASGQRAALRRDLAARFGLDPDRPWLLAVAMMRQDVKLVSYRLLAAALAQILDRPWQLLVVGDGPGRLEVECLLNKFIAERATLAGILDPALLPTCYAAADVYVWPAVREAYGLAILEAQAAGLPVVAGREGGVAEVVRAGSTGILTPAGDSTAFAAAVAALLDQPHRRRQMAEAAKAFVLRERSLAEAAGRLDAAIEAAQAIRAVGR